jgi:hypothetical protein
MKQEETVYANHDKPSYEELLAEVDRLKRLNRQLEFGGKGGDCGCDCGNIGKFCNPHWNSTKEISNEDTRNKETA